MTVPMLTYSGGPGHRVDLDRLVASRMLIQANSGGGKSRAIRQLLEETHGRIQHLVIDPEGEFATLRERFDYVLAAPRDGDVLATPKTARLLCRRLVELGASAVLDIYDLDLGGRREFVKLFLTELMALPRSLWRPVLVVIDEAHVFAPQTGESQALDAVTALCTQGRKRGFAAVLATQRIAKLHKDAAAELLNKLVGRTGLDVDLKRAGDELGFDKDQRATLKTLEPGTFFTYGPAISNAVVQVRTGKVVTSHPEAGKVSAAPPPAPERVQRVLAQLADLAQKADEEARTVADLERRNRELTVQIRRLERGAVPPPKPEVDQAAVDRAVAAALAKHDREVRIVFDRRGKVLAQIAEGLDSVGAVLVQSAIDLRQVQELPAPSTNGHSPEPAAAARRILHTSVKTSPVREKSTAPQSGLSRGQQKILNALAEMRLLGIWAPSRTQLGMFAGYNLTGGTGAQHIADLVAAGLVEIPKQGAVQLTDAGLVVGETSAAPTSLEELHERVLTKTKTGQRRIAEHLISIYPEPITRADLGLAVGYNLTGGTGAQHVADLVNLGVVTIPRQGQVAASPLLFPETLS